MMSCTAVPGRSSGVVDAAHSSRSSNNGWWLSCSTLAIMGIKEPNTKLLDSAGPEKSPAGTWVTVRSVTGKCFKLVKQSQLSAFSTTSDLWYLNPSCILPDLGYLKTFCCILNIIQESYDTWLVKKNKNIWVGKHLALTVHESEVEPQSRKTRGFKLRLIHRRVVGAGPA